MGGRYTGPICHGDSGQGGGIVHRPMPSLNAAARDMELLSSSSIRALTAVPSHCNVISSVAQHVCRVNSPGDCLQPGNVDMIADEAEELL